MSVAYRTLSLGGLVNASRKVAELERELAEAHATRDDLIRAARREARCTIAEIQTASNLSRAQVNRIIARRIDLD